LKGYDLKPERIVAKRREIEINIGQGTDVQSWAAARIFLLLPFQRFFLLPDVTCPVFSDHLKLG
jgi:hypothetical protein